MQKSKKILVAAPHADDELIGLGGSLLRWKSEGAFIKIILFACSDIYMAHKDGVVEGRVRAEEFTKAAALLSTELPEILYLPDSHLDLEPISSIVSHVDRVLNDFQPDIFLYPEPSYHQDHQVVNRACTASLRPTRPSRPTRILTYEIPTSSWVGSAAHFIPNYYVDVSGFIDEKARVFRDVYKSQFSDTSRCKLALEGILSHARYRGHECGSDSAEAFCSLFTYEGSDS